MIQKNSSSKNECPSIAKRINCIRMNIQVWVRVSLFESVFSFHPNDLSLQFNGLACCLIFHILIIQNKNRATNKFNMYLWSPHRFAFNLNLKIYFFLTFTSISSFFSYLLPHFLYFIAVEYIFLIRLPFAILQ